MKYIVSIIGSFKQHYEEIVNSLRWLNKNGIQVNTPLGNNVVKEGIDFVRFTSDDPRFTDAEIQTFTLKKIFNSQATYVIAPEGYVGRTTCYEVGRIIQNRHPLYFSSRVSDLPIFIPDNHIVSVQDFANIVKSKAIKPIYDKETGFLAEAENSL